MELTAFEIIVLTSSYFLVALTHAFACLNQLHHASMLYACRQKDVKNVSKKMAAAATSRLKLSLVWPVLLVMGPLKIYKTVKWHKENIRG